MTLSVLHTALVHDTTEIRTSFANSRWSLYSPAVVLRVFLPAKFTSRDVRRVVCDTEILTKVDCTDQVEGNSIFECSSD